VIAVVPPVAEPAPEPEPVPVPAPVVSWAPPEADEPASTNGDHAAMVADGAPIVVEQSMAELAAAAPAMAVAPAPVVAPIVVTPPTPAPVAAAPVKRRRLLHGFPLSAALEVLAVLLVLAFILLRLS
jgi:hypothetical protein